MKKFLKVFKEYFDSIFYSSLQIKLGMLAFIIGSIMCMVCLFWVPPPGEISTSAIQAVGMFLILSGSAAGIKVAFDLQNQKLSAKLEDFKYRMRKREREAMEREVDEEENTLF